MSERDRGDRPKKSWRELDAQRDRAGPRPPRKEGPREPGAMDARASKQYRAALDALFAKGEVGKLADKLAGTPGAQRLDPAELLRAQSGGAPPPSEAPAPVAKAARESVPVAKADEPETPRSTLREPVTGSAAPKVDDGRAALRKKVLEALARDEISRAVDRYVKQLGWPADFEVLEQALEHTKEERQGEAMAQLEKLLARDKPKRSRTLAGKLRFIEETSDSAELREQAARIRAKL
jgi:hypothetical protein